MISEVSTRSCIPTLFPTRARPVEAGPVDVYEPGSFFGPGGSNEERLIPPPVTRGPQVVPLRQHNKVSCGQTSVAMAVNSLTGKHLQDTDIDRVYRFDLRGALNAETGSWGWKWRDGGNLSAAKWPLIEKSLDQGGPVLVGLNGPKFSPSGKGHIVVIVDVDGDRVTYVDPADKTQKDCTRKDMERAPSYPGGNFIYYPRRTE